MRFITTILLVLLAYQANSTDPERRKRADLLLAIENKQVSIFINSIYTDAKTVCDKYDLPLALLIAEACYKSNFGKSQSLKKSNNLLGIRFEGVPLHFESKLQCFELWASTVAMGCFKDLPFMTINGWVYQYGSCGFAPTRNHRNRLRTIAKRHHLKIIRNDCCFQAMKLIPSGSIDVIIADLPYGVTNNTWDKKLPLSMLWCHYNRLIKPNGVVILFGQGLFSANLMLSNREMYRYSLVWHKTTPTGFLNANRMPMRSHEDILIFYKKQPTYNPQKTQGHERKVSKTSHHTGKTTDNYGDHKFTDYDSTERFPTSVLTFKTDKQKEQLHPTQKPVKLIEWLLKTYSNEGDVVLDNTAGSGTTGVAAINTKRKFILIEKDPEFYEICKRRCNQKT